MATVNFWGSATTTLAADGAAAEQGINLGLVFKPNVAGSITHLRFYETPNMQGTVTLRLYNTSATVLASATYSATNGASGWREVALASPYTTTSGTWYMVAYHSPIRSTSTNTYSTVSQLLSTVRNTSGSELTTADDGAQSFGGNTGNGRYQYGGLGMPANTFASENYGADVVFDTGGGSSVTGSGTATLPLLTAAAAATLALTGAGTATLPAFTSTGSAQVRLTGSSAATLPAMGASGAGTLRLTGSGTQTLPALTGTGAGSLALTGSGAGTLPTLTGTGSGMVGDNVTGAGTATLPALTSSGGGQVGSNISGAGTATLPGLTSGGAGSLSLTGLGPSTLPAFTGAGAGQLTTQGTSSVTLPALTASGSGAALTPVTGSGTATLPALTHTGSDMPKRDITVTFRLVDDRAKFELAPDRVTFRMED